MRNSIVLLAAVFVLIIAAPAYTDCPSGQRDTTAAEQATLERVATVLPAAFPKLEGWEPRRERNPTVRTTTCLNAFNEPPEPIASWYSVYYIEMAGAAPGREKVNLLTKSMSDPSKVDMETRLKQIQAKIREIQRDTLIKVNVAVNQKTNYAKGKRVTVPGGYLAFQTTGDKNLSGQMKTVVLMGVWKRGDDGQMHATFAADAPMSRVQSVVVVIEAEAKRTQSYLRQANLKSLAGLIGLAG